MKKLWIALLALVLVFSLCACSREFTFEENTSVLGVDVSGCNREDAWTRLEAAVSSYTLDLTIDEIALQVSGREIGLGCSQDAFLNAVQAMEDGTNADFSSVVTFDEGKLKDLIQQNFNKELAEATLIFDETANAYQLTPHAEGLHTDPDAVVAAVRNAICTLTSQQNLSGLSEAAQPVRRDDDPELLAVVELLNKMTGIELTYAFQEGDGNNSVAAHQIPGDVIRSFVDLGEDGFSPAIDQEAVDAYALELSEKYSIEGTTGPFQTTGGGTLNMTVTYEGLALDPAAIAQDIVTCMQEGISGERTIPYLSGGVRDMAYGGTYIEVDLSAQHLWFYKNGECLSSTNLVSGMVGAGWNTPTGIYSIYSKTAGTYLVGEDYRTYVNYWMPFSGGYGLHDATWRGSFGGDIYLYDGSHGCVNLPLSAAKTIYNNASVGTKVILYGGVGYVPPLDQKLTGTTSYDVADDAKSFKLDIKAAHKEPKITYSSSNSAVAAVSEDGTVTVKGIGTATITVKADKTYCYTDATATVTVTVHSACEDGRHQMGEPVVTTQPTCQPGVEKATCQKCDHFTETELAPVQSHAFGDWVIIQESTCGADGSQERTCTICSAVKETGTIPATGNHTPGEWVVTDATCSSEGKRTQSCTVCGKELAVETLPMLSHSFDGAACTLCGAANPDYTETEPQQ